MKLAKTTMAAVVLATLLGFVSTVWAQTADKPADTTAPPAAPPAAPAPAYSEKGADTCLTCHGEGWRTPILPIFKTKHGQRGDSRTPFGAKGLQCESCHGPGAAHAGSADKTLITGFGPQSAKPVSEQNRPCLECHRGNARTHWAGSTHEKNEVACANCHTIHVEHDTVLRKATQADVCYKCHLKQRADFNKPTAHPVRFGKMACSDCHGVHGTDAKALLAKPTTNQTCYTCHAEKRGPFLWEHAPAAEDCTTCHSPHGTVYQALLKKSPPLLCQQCHAAAGHPSVPYTSSALPGGSNVPSGFLLAGSCMNCHSQVHGSNHPSGVKLMR